MAIMKSDRMTIKQMWEDGYSVAAISGAVGVSRWSIYQELRRGRPDGVLDHNYRPFYDPELAERNHQAAAFRGGRPRKN